MLPVAELVFGFGLPELVRPLHYLLPIQLLQQ
jgi:hypothetical protein